MIKRIESLEQDEKRSVLNLNSGKVGIFALVLSLTLACNDILAQSNNVSGKVDFGQPTLAENGKLGEKSRIEQIADLLRGSNEEFRKAVAKDAKTSINDIPGMAMYVFGVELGAKKIGGSSFAIRNEGDYFDGKILGRVAGRQAKK